MCAGRVENFIEVELVQGGDDFDYFYTMPPSMVKKFYEYQEEFGERMAREKYLEFLVFDRHDWINNPPTKMRKIYILE